MRQAQWVVAHELTYRLIPAGGVVYHRINDLVSSEHSERAEGAVAAIYL